MSSGSAVGSEWETLRTEETRKIEDLLRGEFESADAYRYNSASIRVRVVDPRFKGLSREQRDDLVEPALERLDENAQADIMNLVLLYPDEPNESFRARLNNEEFEHPSQSML
jgi:stress-induced morphogen